MLLKGSRAGNIENQKTKAQFYSNLAEITQKSSLFFPACFPYSFGAY